MTDEELKNLVASLAVSQAKTDHQIQETSQELKALSRQVKQTNKQLGEMGNRWGGYTEGLFYPGLSHLLLTEFQMDTVAPRVRSRRKDLELDILGYANGCLNTAYVVEIKARADDSAVEQLLNTLAEFPHAFPEHAGKKVYGILAAVDVPPNIRQRVNKLGIYLARTSDDLVKLEKPAKFIPKNYGQTVSDS
jgi:hypothetical protein